VESPALGPNLAARQFTDNSRKYLNRRPADLAVVNRVMAIPGKRTTLMREEMDAILAVPDQSTWVRSRDDVRAPLGG
jgi:hypothetical protein